MYACVPVFICLYVCMLLCVSVFMCHCMYVQPLYTIVSVVCVRVFGWLCVCQVCVAD